MRKKLLTVALAAVMVLGSVANVFAASSPSTNDSPITNGSSSTSNGVETEADATISEETATELEKAAKIEGLTGVTLEVSTVLKTEFQAVQKAGATVLKDKVYEVVDLKLSSKATQLDKAIKVTLPLFESIKDAKWIAVYRLDGTTLKALGTVEVKDGAFTFETDHFSTYVFAKATAPATTDSKPATGDTAPITTAVVIAALAAASFAAVSLKKKTA